MQYKTSRDLLWSDRECESDIASNEWIVCPMMGRNICCWDTLMNLCKISEAIFVEFVGPPSDERSCIKAQRHLVIASLVSSLLCLSLPFPSSPPIEELHRMISCSQTDSSKDHHQLSHSIARIVKSCSRIWSGMACIGLRRSMVDIGKNM